MADFVMPKLGADMSAGRLVAWLKQPGDHLQRGDIVAEVETDKADIEVEVFTAGVLEKLLVQPGEKVPVGTPLATIREDGKPARTRRDAAPAASPAPAAPAAAPAPTPAVPAAPPEAGRLRISPAARKAAADLGVDASMLAGTGPGGRITLQDVERAAAARTAPPPPTGEADRTLRIRQTIAAAMARSKREIPHYYLITTINMHAAVTWLAAENERRPVTERLLYGVLLLKAVALALRDFPELNAVWTGERVEACPGIHVGVAVSLRQGGLIAPALHDTDRQSLDELMRNFRDLVKRARAGTLRSSELSDPTITITSLGEQGVEAVFGVIYPPQVALVGFGRLAERPWSVEGGVVSRPLITATLSADHRVSDGHRGSLFLAAVDRLLQDPGRL